MKVRFLISIFTKFSSPFENFSGKILCAFIGSFVMKSKSVSTKMSNSKTINIPKAKFIRIGKKNAKIYTIATANAL